MTSLVEPQVSPIGAYGGPVTSDDASNISWWQMLTSPSAMFPHVPHSVAVILYSSIVIAALIILLALMWICTCIASRKKPNPEAINDEPIAEIPTPRSTPQKKSPRPTAPKQAKGGDTLKHLENMPWWDYIAKHPCVNWYDYYRMVEGKSRSRSFRRHCHPCKGNHKKGLEDHFLYHKERSRELPCTNHDSDWERIRPSHIELSSYYRTPKAHKPGFFPRFPMIPRASWTNERLMGHIPGNEGDSYANRSIASLNSSDMQIMQMIAKRKQLQSLRPNPGDVFFGQHIKPHHFCTHHMDSVNHNAVSPYELHNMAVAQRHSTGLLASREGMQSQGTHAIPWSPTLTNDDVFIEGQSLNSQLPAPPEYPPPPLPLSET